MKIIAKPKGHGKTTELIRMAANGAENIYIVVLNHERAHRVFHLAQEMRLQIPFPITYDELERYTTGRYVEGFCLDDIDQAMLGIVRNRAPGRPVLAAAITHRPVLGYICAVCGAQAECALDDLGTGATLTCNVCGSKTMVSLQPVETC